MKLQKDIFCEGEANAWYDRNYDNVSVFDSDRDPIIRNVVSYLRPGMAIAEVGCALAGRLNALVEMAQGRGLGLDPSEKAISDASIRYPELQLSRGTADVLPWEDRAIDILIYGFCLYLCDRADLFRIAAEGDRVLSEGGIIVIFDFKPPFPYKNRYMHRDGSFSYKLDYSSLWSWNPDFVRIREEICDHVMVNCSGGRQDVILPDDRIAVTILQKVGPFAYQNSPVYGEE
jgi:ubiquinone/menaquinone biosynthesis C-methylase UbiE